MLVTTQEAATKFGVSLGAAEAVLDVLAALQRVRRVEVAGQKLWEVRP